MTFFWTLQNREYSSRDARDTKYRYCRYLPIGGKYQYFYQVSLVFDTEPALFMVSMYVQKPQENVNQSEEKLKKRRKAENANFFLQVCLMELDHGNYNTTRTSFVREPGRSIYLEN